MLVALVGIVVMGLVKTTGGKTTSTYDNIQSQMTAQGIGSKTSQTPSGMAAATPSGSGNSSGSDDSGGSDAQDRERNNNGNHYGQNRNGNNGHDNR